MEDNNKQHDSAPGSGNQANNSGNGNVRGAATKTGLSGKSMIEENNIENTMGGGITGGNVVGGVSPEENDDAGTGNSGGNEGTSGGGA